MRKLLTVGLLALVGLAASGSRAQAWHWNHHGPWAQTAAFPSANPPGWYTNTYSFAWQYPWFAYYNYSQGPYANWMAGGGYAYYGGVTPHPITYAPWAGPALEAAAPPPPVAGPVPPPGEPIPLPKKEPAKEEAVPGKVAVRLPADARLLFNGTAAVGTGTDRTFSTPPLRPGVDYGYELTAEVVRGGTVERVTGRVVVRAGETASVTLVPGPVVAAGR